MHGLSRRQLARGLAGLGVAIGLPVLAGCRALGKARSGTPATRTYRLGLLTGSLTLDSPEIAALRQGLGEHGYVEGSTLTIVHRFADGRIERFPALAQELVAEQVEIIVTEGAPASRAAKDASSTIPIVFALASDPVGNGLVASLAHPGGNLTGQVYPRQGISAKRLALIKDAVPGVRRIAVLWNAANAVAQSGFLDVQTAAAALAVELQSLEVRTPADFDGRLRRRRATPKRC